MTEQEFQNKFTIQRLGFNPQIGDFDCLDEDLNDFIRSEAIAYEKSLLSMTYLINDKETGELAAYFSLANDKISITDFESKTEFNRFRKQKFVNEKRLRSYPALKIGRLAISYKYQSQSLGRILIDFIKQYSLRARYAGCRFVTVDAYVNALPFYIKNDYQFLNNDDEDKNTRVMYFDLASLL
ncbi:MAG: GNAT family N-acetyltransferase [Muribaculaceae bacterium]|nr:GNAT family N-acetyltransferase [Muribaculaceae bacterium]